MALEPDYGETLLNHEEAAALMPEARQLLGDPIRKADLYDLEQRIQVEVADEWWGRLSRPIEDSFPLSPDHALQNVRDRVLAPKQTVSTPVTSSPGCVSNSRRRPRTAGGRGDVAAGMTSIRLART